MKMNQNNEIKEGVIKDIASVIGALGTGILDLLKSIFGKLFGDAENSKFDNSLKQNEDWKKSSDMVSLLDVNSKDPEVKSVSLSVKKIEQVIGCIGTFAKEQNSAELKQLFVDSSKLFLQVSSYNMQLANDIIGNQSQTDQQLQEQQPAEVSVNDMLSSLTEETTMDFEQLSKDVNIKPKLDELGIKDQLGLDNFKKMLISKREELKL